MKSIFCFLVMATLVAVALAQPAVVPGDRNPRPAKLWGNNVQVTDKSIFAFDADYRSNGEIWLACISSAAAPETVTIVSSSDGGLNWATFQTIVSNYGLTFTDVGIVCGDTMLYVPMPQDTAAGMSRDYLYAVNYSQTTVHWPNFAAGSAVGIIDELEIDRSAAPGDTMCAFYHTAGDEMSMVYSWDQGGTWSAGENISACNSPGITWVRDTQWAAAYRYLPVKLTSMARSYNNGQSWGWSPGIDTTDADTLNASPAIAACHGTGQVFVATSWDGGATWMKEIRVYCATDGADTQYVNTFGFQYEGDQGQPTVNCLRFGGNDWGNVAYCDYGSGADSVRYAYNYQGGAFSEPATVSDRPGAGQATPMRPKIAYCDDGSHPGPAVFYAGADRQGIYMNAGWLTGIAGGHPTPLAGSGLELGANRPNPFSRGTAISYQLPAPGRIGLRVYNAAGQLVRTLVDGPQAAGRHSIKWDGRDGRGAEVSSGVYLYRLEAGGEAAVGRMTVVR